MLSPDAHLALIYAELALLRQRPLSARQARLVAGLLETMPDRIYAARRADGAAVMGATDRADFFARVVAASPAMARIAALGDGRARLETVAAAIPREAVAAMDVRDFMVSVYNDQTVPTLMLVDAEGAVPVIAVFADAAAWWAARP